METTRTTPCRSCPLQGCPGLRPLTPEQLADMEAIKSGEISLARGEAVIRQGHDNHRLFTVLDGVLIKYRNLDDGRRQIVNFMFPGDLLGLQAAFDEPAGHSVEALIDSRLCVFPQQEFLPLTTRHPEFSFDLIWLVSKEENALEGHIVALGQRNARERVAYLAVWLLDRAQATCLARPGNVLNLPITQNQIADMLGLSLVHTNRTLRQLERERLVTWKSREICVHDKAAAAAIAQFPAQDGRRRPFL